MRRKRLQNRSSASPRQFGAKVSRRKPPQGAHLKPENDLPAPAFSPWYARLTLHGFSEIAVRVQLIALHTVGSIRQVHLSHRCTPRYNWYNWY